MFTLRSAQLQLLVGAVLRIAQLLHPRQRCGQVQRQGVGNRTRRGFAFHQSADRSVGVLRAPRVEFQAQPIGLRLQAMVLAFQLLDTRRLHLGALPGGTEFAVEALPVLLPARQFSLRGHHGARGLLLARAARLDQRFELGNLGVQSRQLLLVAHDLLRDRAQIGAYLRQVAAGTFAQLARVADILLGAGNLGPEFVIAALHARRGRAELAMEIALLFNRRFRRALIRQRLLHVQFARAYRTVLHCGAAVEFTQPQRQQLRSQGALLGLQVLVAAGGIGLALQVADLLVDLVAQVLQARQVLTRIGHARSRSRGGAPYIAIRPQPPR